MSLPIERGLAKTFAGHIHWRACGPASGAASGAPTVMISHINQQSSAVMVELLQALGPHFRAVAIDYPSHGHSDHVDWQPAIEDYARCAIEVMDSLGIARAFALGEAVGAAVSIALAAHWKDRIDRIVPVNIPHFGDQATATRDIADIAKVRPSDPTGFPSPRSIDYLLQHDPEHAPMQPTQSWMDRINRAQLEAGRERWQVLDALHQYDMPANVPQVTCPALQLTGEHFIYVKDHHEFASRIKNLRQIVLPGGRCCIGWEKADDIARHAIEFLR